MAQCFSYCFLNGMCVLYLHTVCVMCMSALPAHSLYTMCMLGVHGGYQRASDPQKQDLQKTVCHLPYRCWVLSLDPL